MKTTNYLISKQLAKAGFSEQVGFLDYYFNTDKELRHRDQENYLDGQNTEVDCFSYDLETILDALPDKINNYFGEAFLSFNKTKYCTSIGYGNDNDIEYIENLYVRLEDIEEGSSLADIAARLWLKLKKEGLV